MKRSECRRVAAAPAGRHPTTPAVGWTAIWFLAVAFGAGPVGCAPEHQEINAFIHDYEASVSGTEYVVQPPDVIEISAAQAPEIDGEVQEVGHDGKITLRLLGQVKVAGLTPVDIARKLESLLGQYYTNPAVNVRLAKKLSKRVYVFGQVDGPGPYKYSGRDTVLSLLAKARPTFLAWKSEIKVIHPSHEGENRHVLKIDADQMMQEGDLAMNVLLEEGDIIFVPPTPLAWVGLRLQEILFPLQPVANMVNQPGSVKRNSEELFDD